jgi:hypothetical protein
MSKQPSRIKPRTLSIDQPINEEDIWHISVLANGKTFNMPYRKSDLDMAFKKGTGDWNCKVLVRFIKGSPINIEKYE